MKMDKNRWQHSFMSNPVDWRMPSKMLIGKNRQLRVWKVGSVGRIRSLFLLSRILRLAFKESEHVKTKIRQNNQKFHNNL